MKFRFCRIEIESKYIYRLLNSTGNIELRNIRRKDDVTSFIIDYKDKESLKLILNEVNINVLKWEDKGLYTKIVNFTTLKIIGGVITIFVFLMLISSLFIWEISVDGNYSYSTNQIESFVNKQNIKEGILKNKVDSNKLEKAIRKEFDDISWVCAEVKGTNLLIHIKENYITEISVTEDEPYDIVANCDGVITSVLVRQGKAMVKVGDEVKKGDILISGVIDVFDESGQKLFTKFCNADGDIWAQTTYEYKDTLNENYEKKIEESQRTLYLPSVCDYKWMNLTNNKNRDVIYSDKKIKLFGNFYLPVSIQKYTVINYKNTPATYTKELAEQMLNNNLLYKLSILEQKGYKILKKDVKINKEKDIYVLTGKITCREPLGEVSYIDVNQYNESEEGTTEFNERN